MNIGLISDTHSYLGKDVIEQIKGCDEIWHAGDIGDESTADAIENIGPPVRMVWGNIDGRELRIRYTKELIWTIDGLHVFMTHIGGYPGRYYKKAFEIIKREQPGLFICGHSHILRVMPDRKNDLIHMNPGACGLRGFHKFRTLLKFKIESGVIKDLKAVELGLRGSLKNKNLR